MSTLTINSRGDASEQGKTILAYMLKGDDSDQKTAADISSGLATIEDTLMDLYSRPATESKKDEKGNTIPSTVTVGGKTFKDLDSAIGYFAEKYKKASRIYATFQEFRKNAHETIMQAIRNLRTN
jgi:hypothetical protein